MPYLAKLIEGYRRFRATGWGEERERWSELAEGQGAADHGHGLLRQPGRPGADLRCRPGEIFVLRNIAALAPPYETTSGYHGVSAALELLLPSSRSAKSSSWATVCAAAARRR